MYRDIFFFATAIRAFLNCLMSITFVPLVLAPANAKPISIVAKLSSTRPVSLQNFFQFEGPIVFCFDPLPKEAKLVNTEESSFFFFFLLFFWTSKVNLKKKVK